MSANFTPNQNDYINLTPFKSWLLLQINTWGQNNFPFVESDFDELTNYGMMLKMMGALNDVISNENEVEQDMTNLFNAFIELQSYVNNYFNNLDIQEEINKKLDEMAEDGSLTSLIKGYIDPIQTTFENRVNASLSSMQSQIDGVASGSPKGVYATKSALSTADPDHDFIYLVTADGKWYYYDESESDWVAGGVYQSTGVIDDEITYDKLNYSIKNDYYVNDYLNNKDSIVLDLKSDDFANGYIDSETGVEHLGNQKYILSRNIYLPTDSWITFEKDETFDISSVVLFFYDKDLNYISHTTIPMNYNFDAFSMNLHPTNSAFVRIQIYNSSTNLNTSDIQYFTFYCKKSFNDYAQWNESINLFNPDEKIETMYISNNNGVLSSSNNYNTSYFIEIEPSTTYTFKNRCRDILEYDENKKSIQSTYINSTTSTNYQHTTNANAKYLRFSYYKTDDEIMMYKGTTSTDYVPYKHVMNKYAGLSNTMRSEIQDIVFNYQNILNGKKLVACGDSFTAWTTEQYDSGRFNGEYKTWPFEIGLRNNMNVQNLAVSGSTMATGTSAGTQFADTRYTQIANDADYIIIKYGINDSHQSVPIGTIDSSDDTTFYGAWNKVMSYIIEHHPTAKIGIIITNGLDIQNDETNLSAYATATINIAKKFGVPTLNEWNDPNVPLLLRTGRTDVDESIRAIRTATFRVDESNTHENAVCQAYESSFIEDFMRRL